MNDKILVAYTTAAGSTAEVAQAIGQELSKNGGNPVEVAKTAGVVDLSPYAAVVLGTGVRAGKVYGDTLAFLERHHDALARLPVAYFVVCMTMKEDTEENRCVVETYVDQMREAAPAVQPLDIGLFAGKLDLDSLPFVLRMLMKVMKREEGDFRDWDAIRSWAAGLNLQNGSL